jgi:AcrR family transcriptional regulator
MKHSRQQPSADRLRSLLEAAVQVFCQCGYARAQMADVAKAMGVATGTVYLYVESKEALFDLVVRAHGGPEFLMQLKLPFKTPKPGATLRYLKSLFDRPHQWPVLEAALNCKRSDDPQTELRGVLSELYDLMSRHRVGFTLLRRSVLEFPGLFELFLQGLRKRMLTDLTRYLRSRVESGQLVPQADEAATAVILLQCIAWPAIHQTWDPGYRDLDAVILRQITIDTLVRGILACRNGSGAGNE